MSLTLRNWVIGAYIRQYEQQGVDRATYGARLLEKLSTALQAALDRCYIGRYFGLCRQLFDVYPSIRKSAISEWVVDAKDLMQRLSVTHLVELVAIAEA